MDAKWIEQTNQDRAMVEDKAWMFRDWVTERTRQLRDSQDADLAHEGKARWLVKHPALVIFPILVFGACVWLLVIGLLAG